MKETAKIFNASPTQPMEPPRALFPGRTVLYVPEVARHLQITRQHVVHLIEEGSLAAINVHAGAATRNCWRIPVEAFRAFLKSRGG